MARIVNDKVYKAAQELGAGTLGASFASAVNKIGGRKYRVERGFFDREAANPWSDDRQYGEPVDSLDEAIEQYRKDDWLDTWDDPNEKRSKYIVIRTSEDGGKTWGEGSWFWDSRRPKIYR